MLWPNTEVQTATWIAIGTIAGGIAQLALVYAAIRRAGFVPKLIPEIERPTETTTSKKPLAGVFTFRPAGGSMRTR